MILNKSSYIWLDYSSQTNEFDSNVKDEKSTLPVKKMELILVG